MAGLTNKDIATVFREIETLMKVLGEPETRTLTYGRVSRIIERLGDSAADLAAAGRLTEIRGIGPSMERVVAELVDRGTSSRRDELAERTSPGVLEMLRVPGLGPKKLHTLVSELDCRSIEALRDAALDGSIAALQGFGAKSAERILEGVAYLNETRGLVRLSEAAHLAALLVSTHDLRDALPAGPLRRGVPVVDLISLVAVGDPSSIELPGASIEEGVWVRPRGAQPEVRLRLVEPTAFARALFEETGPVEHVSAVLAQDGSDGSEEEIYESRGLHYVPPERRHACNGSHPVPTLIQRSDLKGMLHCHTTWSDGRLSVAEMADAARSRGYSYLGITDHSKTAVYAHGLDIDRLQEQGKEIRAYNANAPAGFRVLHGTEVDILADGAIDYPDEVLAELDFVIASVHSVFGQDPEKATGRILKAVRNPHVDILGHATGRLLLRRGGYAVDMEQVLPAAAEAGTMIELNANPWRLDLDPSLHPRAQELGVGVPICPDAHSADGMEDNDWGVLAARHGGLRAADVPNCLDVDGFLGSCKA